MKMYAEQVLTVINEAVRIAGSQNQLAEAMGTNRAKICKWLSGTSPTTKDFGALADYVGAQIVLPGQSVREYSRVLALRPEDAGAHSLAQFSEPNTPVSVLEYVGQKRHHQPDVLFSPDLLAKLNLDAADGVLYTPDTDAMAPAVHRGDQVLLDRTQTAITDGGMYLFQRGPTFILRFAARELDKLQLYTASNVPPIFVSAEQEKELHVIGKVVWIGKKL